MTKKIADMRDVVGADCEIAISFPVALLIVQILGTILNFRSQVLLSMLCKAKEHGPISKMFAYICEMLCWNDMESILLILKELCLTKSPVKILVIGECYNLYAVKRAIQNTELPQYFKILQPYGVACVMETEKFPVLLAVANRLRLARHVSAGHVPRVARTDSVLVNEMVAAHQKYMNQYLPNFVYIVDETPQDVLDAADRQDVLNYQEIQFELEEADMEA